jgi:hypothetical protein
MERTHVESASVVSVGYDPDDNSLEVEFTGGRIYRYFLVPHEVYVEMLASDSIGRFVNAEIRNRYPYRQVPAR